MEWFLIIMQAIIFGIFCNYIAKEKNRDQFSWFMFGFFFSFIALIALAAVPKLEISKTNNITSMEFNTSNNFKKCPDCAEIIKSDARICRFCRHEFSEEDIAIAKKIATDDRLSTKNIIKCSNCGEEVLYEETFCSQCGIRLDKKNNL